MKYVWVLMTALIVMVAGVTSAQASTVCFKSKIEAKQASPGSKIFYTSIKTTGNDHVDFVNAGPVGSKCWHIHNKLKIQDHLPRYSDNYIVVEYMSHFWPLPDYPILK